MSPPCAEYFEHAEIFPLVQMNSRLIGSRLVREGAFPFHNLLQSLNGVFVAGKGGHRPIADVHNGNAVEECCIQSQAFIVAGEESILVNQQCLYLKAKRRKERRLWMEERMSGIQGPSLINIVRGGASPALHHFCRIDG